MTTPGTVWQGIVTRVDADGVAYVEIPRVQLGREYVARYTGDPPAAGARVFLARYEHLADHWAILGGSGLAAPAAEIIEVLFAPVAEAVLVSTSRPWRGLRPDVFGVDLVGVGATLDVAGTTTTTVTPLINGVSPYGDAANLAAGTVVAYTSTTGGPAPRFIDGPDELTIRVDPAGAGARGLLAYCHLIGRAEEP